jgi:acyl-coenzyme A synthetase/AMP-(fatty) acid ligase
VKEAVVVGRRDEIDGEIPTAFIVLRAEASADELQAHCRDSLAAYEAPRLFRFVTEIPKNAVGKPLRRLLRDSLNGA